MTRDFRWQALFQQCREPLFVLNRKRRVLFVNRAWEKLTGVDASEARRWVCTRRQHVAEGPGAAVARALWPPSEALLGSMARARRLFEGSQGPCWWDIEFFPLRGDDGLLGILGKITGPPLQAAVSFLPLPEALRLLHDRLAARLPGEESAQLWRPERLVGLRESAAGHYRLDLVSSPLPAVQRVFDQARLASRTRVPVLLAGERGTGKHWLARAIHYHGPDRERVVAVLDCAHLPAGTVAELLLGAGGLWQRPGVGTVYLKEPSRLPHELQGRLHDLLAETGAESAPGAGPRVIAGMSADAAADVRAGRLLEKLACVLGTLLIPLPPLRERLADLPELVERMLERLAAAGARKVVGLTPDAWELVREYRWPGNLRELYETLAAGAPRASGDRIDVADLPAPLRLAVRLEETPGPAAERSLPLDHLLEEAERRLIELALRRTRGNKSKAADLLGVVRPRLFRRIEALGIKD